MPRKETVTHQESITKFQTKNREENLATFKITNVMLVCTL